MFPTDVLYVLLPYHVPRGTIPSEEIAGHGRGEVVKMNVGITPTVPICNLSQFRVPYVGWKYLVCFPPIKEIGMRQGRIQRPTYGLWSLH